MTQARSAYPDVAIFGDHEIITPANRLAAKALVKVSLPDDDPVARAEAALADLSIEFTDWMAEECDRLDAARKALKDQGIGQETIDELYFASHDVSGDAATFGYPLAGPAAESLCKILEHSPAPERIPLVLIDQHVDAVRAIVREYARPDIAEVANALTQRLRMVSQDYLVHVNRHRPGYLDSVLTQPLAYDGF